MTHRERLATDASISRHSIDRVTPSKFEFGQRLQKALNDRNWSQADLARQVERITGEPMGRDAVSTYINGRSFPTPASLNRLCKALDMTREELFPNALMNAPQDEQPAFEMRAVAGQPGQAWVRVSGMMSFETATEIARLFNEEERARTKAGGE